MNQTADKPIPTPAVIERLPRRETIIVESGIPTLDTGMFEHMQRIANTMASSSLVPAHLNSVRKVGGVDVVIEPKEAVANCFLVINQAIRWRMDPFAVAQHVFTTNGRIGYEGKLIAAIINSHPNLEKRLVYTYEDTGENRKVTVSAQIKGDSEVRTITGNVKDWKTTRSGSPWANANQHDQMLAYRGAREWARRWMPEVILGVWSDDELDQFESTQRTLHTEAPNGDNKPARGAEGLKAALNAGNVSDAEVIQSGQKPADPQPDPAQQKTTEAPAGEKTEQKPGQQKGGKQKGTLELHDKYINRIKESSDLGFVSLLMDEARSMYEWTPEDLKTIEFAYKERVKELERR